MADKESTLSIDDILNNPTEIDYEKVLRSRVNEDALEDIDKEKMKELCQYAEKMIADTPLDEYTDAKLNHLVESFRIHNGMNDMSLFEGEKKKNADFSKEREMLKKGNNAIGYSRRKIFGR